jgi:TRAP transporter 4TM/12TM fusion protein
LDKVPWYDAVLFSLTVVVSVYLGVSAVNIARQGWEFLAPIIPTIFSVILWLLVLEAVRRSTGTVLATICLLFSLYPVFAGYMPFFLRGQNFDFLTTVRNHAMSVNGILGVPLMTVGTLLVGYMIFGVVLQNTGGGDFFLDLARALLGHTRGGPAKVAIVASSLFGSLSGSAISNVITTGSITIPAMKKTGYSPTYAGGIEACASTGGTIMPPIMGAAAFVMASFLGRPYAEIVIAAIIPSLLFYMGLFFQVDAHAAKIGLKGDSRNELPPIWPTIKSGWYFFFVIVALFYFLFALRLEQLAPFYASFLLIILSFFSAKNRLNVEKAIKTIEGSGKTLVELVTVLAAVGLIVGALSVTGVAFAFSRELVARVDGLLPLLFAGAITSFILGFGMTSIACYIFLAIVMAPALVAYGVDPIAAHFFVLYWGVLSFITPPVALAAFAAAGIAGADPMKTGYKAMQLGVITYFIPFFFVYNPALLAQGPLGSVMFYFLTAVIGVYLISAGLEGYLVGINQKLFLFSRLMLIIGGSAIFIPERMSDLIGIVIAVIGILLNYYYYKIDKKEVASIN